MLSVFWSLGTKLKYSFFFRGREIVHRENGQKLLVRVTETLEDIAVVEQEAKQEGRTLCMIFAPKSLKKKA
jgi:translation initiation factor IF-3